jgi:methyltransferase (TIGR00027 family)
VRSGGPSVTAQHVAAYRLAYEREPAPFGAAADDDRLARDVAALDAFERNERMDLYLRARTAFFDRVVVTALEHGVRQVVVVAAGYDGRALRYAKPGVTWFEVDHPATQADKRARLDRLGIDAPHVTFVAADLVQPGLAAALGEHGLDPATPSLMLAEGLIVYLDEEVVESMARELRTAAAPGSRLAVSASPTVDEERRRRFAASVEAIGEPARSHTSATETQRLLEAAGWRATQLPALAHEAGFVVAGAE